MGCNASVPAQQTHCADSNLTGKPGSRAAPGHSREAYQAAAGQDGVGLEVRSAPARAGSSSRSPRDTAAQGGLSWASLSPALLLVDDFLSSSECDALVALASSDGHISSGRTSYSCFLTNDKATHPLVCAIEKRMVEFANAAQTSLDEIEGTEPSARVVSAEPVQGAALLYMDETRTQKLTLLRQGYTSHFDNRAGSQARKATFMVYLNDTEAGGHTFFPRARPTAGEGSSAEHSAGVKISPNKGRAVFFFNIRHGREDECSLHEAMPVLAGEKMICTLWLGQAEKND